MFNKVLVANRGAVAARVLRALRVLGIRSVAVYSEADAGLRYLADADETYSIGASEPKASYLNQEVLMQVLSRSGADGVHPGYGFLSESAEFAQRVNAAGARFIGPSPKWIEAMGHKTRARDLMSRHGLSMAPSSGLLDGRTDAALEAARILGYPVLVKPAAGGGGIGMVGARDESELIKAIEKARSLAERSFCSTELYLENLMLKPRHIEFQVLADRYGNIRHLFERDCSVQRRYQKVIEESPAPLISRTTVEKAANDIVKVLGKLPYDVIGTVETLYEKGTDFRFLEMNTRLQVEHAVTEEITGIDLVVAQIRLAAGERLDSVLPAAIPNNGHAIEARIYAEDPVRFYPSPGILKTFRLAPGLEIRTETGYSEGDEITSHYDPLIVKVIAHGHNRDNAIDRMLAALDATVIEGIKHNIPFVQRVLRSEQFRSGHVHTGLGMEVAGPVSKSAR
ncbi:acetyl-CoA carboxylase biotin carboxylase subunit [Paralcaligenes ureilyticus]|uniref:Acetyl-CoA carboxylase biotin carboxylase subunit n=1 Tax=Paralcaligenes ureilyticus TaxID=627131 RepID=A0A4R3M8H4_9BURK|nr:biotin carboxylase N-terminal domain-containing protein [Paralcaligenes ureilyticus]TCT08589.1 acetyl-CoA carboxylase biotin carboxylase subunit [Paralcaligenes ureilyticus]